MKVLAAFLVEGLGEIVEEVDEGMIVEGMLKEVRSCGPSKLYVRDDDAVNVSVKEDGQGQIRKAMRRRLSDP